jgi:hypothetical protein
MNTQQEDSVEDTPETAEEIAAAQRYVSETIKSPIDRAIAARNLAKKNPHPDAALLQQKQLRTVPEAPLDLLSVKLSAPPGGKDTAGEMVAGALKYLHGSWTDLREAAGECDKLGLNYVNPVERLHVLGSKALERQLDNLSNVQRELMAREAQAQQELDAAVMVRVDPALAQDIRHAFAAKKGQVMEDIRRDPRVASAVLAAPLLVLGVDQAKIDTFRDVAERTHAPERRARVDHLKRLARHTATAVDLVRRRLEPAIERWTPRKESAALKRLVG